jgi:hypothetical protein
MKKQQVKKGKSLEGEKNHKKKEGNAPRDKRIFEIIRQRIFLKLFPSDQSISIQGCYTIVTCIYVIKYSKFSMYSRFLE